MTSPDASPMIALAAQALPDAGSPPAEIMLLPPTPTIQPADGRAPWRIDDPQALADASMSGRDLVIDFDHQTDRVQRGGGGAPAAGWITGMTVRDGAIWGAVNWTPRGIEALSNRDYRFVSPVLLHDRSGRIHRIARAGLVNDPAIPTLPALAAKEPYIKEPYIMSDTPESDAPAAPAPAAAAPPDPALYAPRAVVDELSTQLAALQTQVADENAARAVAAAAEAGKVTPAMRDWALALASRDPAGFADYVAKAPALIAAGPAIPPDGAPPPAAALSKIELAICSAMALDPQAYSAHRAQADQEADDGAER